MVCRISQSKDKELIDLMKSEASMVFNQMHTRMAYKYTIISIGLLGSGGIIGLLKKFPDTSESISIQKLIFILVAIFLYIFILIIAREDIILADHDKYIYFIRKKISMYFGYQPDYFILGFLQFIKISKKDSMISKFLSFLTYLTLLLPAFIYHYSFFVFLISIKSCNVGKDFYVFGWILFCMACMLFAAVCISIITVALKHQDNESILKKINKDCKTLSFPFEYYLEQNEEIFHKSIEDILKGN